VNVQTFLQHWRLSENPFRAEEARHDAVFGRLDPSVATHPEFDKILGEFDRPATSIVFGEKGSGKTAIRMQMAERLADANGRAGEDQVFLIPYDDLNPVIDQFCLHLRVEPGEDPLPALHKFRLIDHMDAILSAAVTRIVDALLNDPRAETDETSLGGASIRRLRQADRTIRRDLMLLQAAYDRPDHAAGRTRSLRRRLRAPLNTRRLWWSAGAMLGWLLPLGVVATWWYVGGDPGSTLWLSLFFAALGVWGVILFKRLVWDQWQLTRLGTRVARHVRVLRRSGESVGESLAHIPPEDRTPGALPEDDSDDPRYAMFARLRRVLRALGFRSAIIVVDRVDEPTLISGEPERMKAVVWPLLSSKFLQMEGFGFKLLLPLELRHALFRESSAFFQEARLDKQNLIEQLGWTGATLYDLCTARLQACLEEGAEPIALADLFAEDVSRQDIVDALDQMHQPRDAFKLLYRCIQEHCSNVTDEQPQWRIPQLILETVRRAQSDRVQQFTRGVRPA